MDDLLDSGEIIVHRSAPGWRTATITIACGLGFAAAIHLLVGIHDDNWTCPASLMWLAVMAPFGIILIARTAGARLILTDRRLLYRRSRSVDIKDVAVADIQSATLSMLELLPSIRIKRCNGDDIFVKYVDRLEDLCERIRNPDSMASSSPRTLRGAFLIVLASFGASYGLWLGMFGLGELILMEPTGTIKAIPEWLDSEKLPTRMLACLALALTTFGLTGPVLGAAVLGAWLGYLPALLASRVLVPFDEARNLALLPRRMTPFVDFKDGSKSSEDEGRPNRISAIFLAWVAIWAGLAVMLICASTDRLARLLFQRPISLDGQAAIKSSGG